MPRIRSIHPGLFTDEAFVSCSPLARLLYIGLWTEADDQGLFEWKPLSLRMRIFPADNADVGELLDELASHDMVRSFDNAGRKFGAIRNFRRFQRPKKPNSTHVMPPEFRNYVGLEGDSSELRGGDGNKIPNRYGTGAENLNQMEDGGGKSPSQGKDDSSGVISFSKGGAA